MANEQHTSPREARDWYIDSRKTELTDSTVRAHKYRLSAFVRFCDEHGIDYMEDLSGRHFDRYKIWRRENGDLNNVTLNTQLSTLRVFVKWAESVELVPKGLHEFITPPSMAPKEDVRRVLLENDRAADVLRHYRKFEYATRDHALLELLWHTGVRSGTLRGIDLDDIDEDAQAIHLRHRPDEETPLKNGKAGERMVGIKDSVFEVLQDYIRYHRLSKVDDYSREPLFSTRFGRISNQAIRRAVYAATRPCVYTNSCPHGRLIDECEAAGTVKQSSQCPTSVSPHAVRKGAITWARLNDIPVDAISGRMDVTPDILEKHYDHRTQEQEMDSRRRYFND